VQEGIRRDVAIAGSRRLVDWGRMPALSDLVSPQNDLAIDWRSHEICVNGHKDGRMCKWMTWQKEGPSVPAYRMFEYVFQPPSTSRSLPFSPFTILNVDQINMESDRGERENLGT
jgi:hypothetical protein